MRRGSDRAGATKIFLLRSAGLAAMAAFVMASQAQAQTNGAVEQVVVTGSRVIQSQLDAPTPTTALSANDLQNIGGGGSLSETLRELPQLAFSSSISTQTISTTGTGNNNAAFLNLRNLGSVRTLVLQDGVRLPPNGSLGSTDVNLIPEALVQRVDTVT